MPEEEKAEVVVDTTQAKEVPETLTVEQLQAMVKNLTADLEATRKEAKSHQEFGRKQQGELNKQRGMETKISGLETRLDVIAEMLANVMDRDEGIEEAEQPKKRRSQEYLGRLKETRAELNSRQAEIDPRQQEFVHIAEEADRLAKSVGLDMEHSPELKDAFRLFRGGIASSFNLVDAQDALDEVQKVVAKKQTPTEAKVDIEKLIEERAQKMLKDKGLLVTDTGSLSSGQGGRVWSMSEVQAMLPSEYQRYFPGGYPDVVAAQREGKIK